MRPYPIGEVVKDATTGGNYGVIIYAGGKKMVTVHYKDGTTFFTNLRNLRVATSREARGGAV